MIIPLHPRGPRDYAEFAAGAPDPPDPDCPTDGYPLDDDGACAWCEEREHVARVLTGVGMSRVNALALAERIQQTIDRSIGDD